MEIKRPPQLRLTSFKKQILQKTHETDHAPPKDKKEANPHSISNTSNKKSEETNFSICGNNKKNVLSQQRQKSHQQIRPFHNHIHKRQRHTYSRQSINSTQEAIPEIAEELESSSFRIKKPSVFKAPIQTLLDQSLQESISITESTPFKKTQKSGQKSMKKIENASPKPLFCVFGESKGEGFKSRNINEQKQLNEKIKHRDPILIKESQLIKQKNKTKQISLFPPKQQKPPSSKKQEQNLKQENPTNFLKSFFGEQSTNLNLQEKSSVRNLTTPKKQHDEKHSEATQKKQSPLRNKEKFAHLIKSIYQIRKTASKRVQSPLRKRQRSKTKREHEENSHEKKINENSKMIRDSLGFFDSLRSAYHTDCLVDPEEEQNYKQLERICFQLLQPKNHEINHMKHRVQNQKNLTLKDYLRLVALSSNTSFPYKTKRSKSIIKTRDSSKKTAIDNRESINVIRATLKNKFSKTMQNAKAYLYKINEDDKEAGYKYERQIQAHVQEKINIYFEDLKPLKEQIHLVQDTYEDLVFMCRFHRIYQDDIFLSIKTLKQLVHNFIEKRKKRKLQEEAENQLRQLSGQQANSLNLKDPNILRNLLTHFIQASSESPTNKEAA